MALTFTPDDRKQMERIERQVSDTLRPYRQSTEGALVVFALLRIARVLLRLYPEPTQGQLIRLGVDFLEGQHAPRDAPGSSLLLQ